MSDALVDTSSRPDVCVASEVNAVVRVRLYGTPKTVFSDNGTELTRRAMLEWQTKTGIEWLHIQVDTSTQNAFIESFNGRLRCELLNEKVFDTLTRRRSGWHCGSPTQTTCGPTHPWAGSRPAAHRWPVQYRGHRSRHAIQH